MTGEYSVSLAERIKALLGEFDDVGPLTEFTYSWNGGYEKFRFHNKGGGSSEYAGSFHPDVVCEPWRGAPPQSDAFVCCWCGSTVW